MSNKKGFTLIEVLIAIVIIGLLAGIIMVKLNDAREKARDKKALQSMSSILPAIQLCLESDQRITPTGVAPVDETVVTANGASLIPTWWFSWVYTDNMIQEGASICNGSNSYWPELSDDWSYYMAVTHFDKKYFMFSSSTPGNVKSIVCSHAPAAWGADINLNYKCVSRGF